MKRWKIPTLIVALSGLTACSASIAPVDPEARRPDPVLFEACDRPGRLPERALAQAEAERFWIRDRLALVTCRARPGALGDYTKEALDALGVTHDE